MHLNFLLYPQEKSLHLEIGSSHNCQLLSFASESIRLVCEFPSARTAFDFKEKLGVQLLSTSDVKTLNPGRDSKEFNTSVKVGS